MKYVIKKILIYLLILLLIITLTGCKKDNDSESLEKKVDTELSYLDTQLIEMLNKSNGLSFENYTITAEKIEQNSTGNSQTQKSSTKEDESIGESSSDSQSKGGSQQEKNNENYNLSSNNILLSEKITDWNYLKLETEKLYATWSTMMLDLYKVNIDNQQILDFGTDLDTLIMSVKNEDKISTLNVLAKLYSYIPKYHKSYVNNSNKSIIYETKSNLINAYAIIEQNKTDEVKKYLSEAEKVYLPILNNIEKDDNQFNINKSYILIKDIQNSIDTDKLDIFYIKYKNLIEEISII